MLYFRATAFAFETGNQMAYASQCEDAIDQVRRTQSKLEPRLEKG